MSTSTKDFSVSAPVSVRLWGHYALFKNPIGRADPVTYPVPTPGAIRGAVEAIYRKPEMYYTVERIAAIRDELLSPPTLFSVSTRPVVTCSLIDPLGAAAKKMRDGSYSQLPVYDGSAFVGLLTAETVARWVASNLADGQELMEEEKVKQVLRHQEDPENHTFLGRVSTVPDGLAAFDDFLHRGKRLEAILVTENGRPTEQPLGIVTIHDIPMLRRAIRE